jgi:hypothetical protein
MSLGLLRRLLPSNHASDPCRRLARFGLCPGWNPTSAFVSSVCTAPDREPNAVANSTLLLFRLCDKTEEDRWFLPSILVRLLYLLQRSELSS